MDGRKIEAAGQNFQQFFAVVGDAAAGSAQGKRRTHNHRKADLASKFQTISQVIHQQRTGHVEPDLEHGVFEEQAVFGLLDRVHFRANELDVVLFEHAAVGKIDGEIQCGLSADRGQHGEARRRETSPVRCE